MDQDQFFEEIDKSEIDDVRKHVEEVGIKGLPDFVASKRREWKHVPLSIALVGEAAVGKSTFINSMRGLTADDVGAAEVGTGDVTKNPTMYPHPYNDQVVFWDLPGVGTPRFPRDESYLGRVGYSKYDFFLLLSDYRFSTNDVWLAREIESMGKRYFFIRTKIDNTMESAEQSQQQFSAADVLKTIHHNCEENFKAAQLQNRTVYCISSYDKDKWDFSTLLEDILVSLPELKRDALVLSLGPLTKSIIRSKSDALRKRANYAALVSGGTGAAASFIPIPLVGGAVSVFLDIGLLMEEVNFYLKQYGLDDESLTELSKQTNMTLDYYKDALKNGSTIVSARQGIRAALMKMIKSEGIEAAVKRVSVECVRWIPVVGALVGGATSFGSTLYLLHSIIKGLEGDALHIMDVIITNASSSVDQ